MAENTKNYSSSYLYTSTDAYQRELMDFVLKGEQVNISNPGFRNIIEDVKRRRIPSSLSNLLTSNKVIMIMDHPLPRAFQVFTATDIRGDGKLRVFMDVNSSISIDKKTGEYTSSNLALLSSQLMAACGNLVYYGNSRAVMMSAGVINSGAVIFSKLFAHVMDYIFKINAVGKMKSKVIYMATVYYLVNVLGKEEGSDTVSNLARKLSGISKIEEEIMLVQQTDSSFLNIKFFIDHVSRVLSLPKLTLELFLEKWLYLYGSGTQFALELFPAFVMVMANVYNSSYVFNQNTIEGLVGRDLVTFSTAIIGLGGDLA